MSALFYKYFFKRYENEIPIKVDFDTDHILKERGIRTPSEINEIIYDKIISGEPFFAGRIGGTENTVIKDYLIFKNFLGVGYVRNKLTNQLCELSGFFPHSSRLSSRFARLMIESEKQIDVQIRWWGGFENYLIEKYTSNDVPLADLPSFEPWQEGVTLPWTAALVGKKVLVIHPFESTIISQYAKREKIWSDPRMLPRFELKTLKAVQTIAGTKDERFDTWFDALDYMYQEAMKIDFDLAIIGCGAYGFPLAARLKQAGKQAIHLAGATQILFGIKGARWETKWFTYVQKFFNEDWCYPSEADKPKQAERVEGGCYW